MISERQTHRYGWLMTVALLLTILLSYFEISNIFRGEQNWERLLETTRLLPISVYLIMLVFGISCLFLAAWGKNLIPLDIKKFKLIRWLLILGLLLIITWIYLYSFLQTLQPGPWTQLIFAAGLVQIILFLAAPDRNQQLSWDGLALILSIFLFPRVVHEVRSISTIPLAYRSVTIGGFLFLIGLIFLLYHPEGRRVRMTLSQQRENTGKLRWLVVALLCMTPFFYRYIVGAETYILYPNLRFAVLLIALWAAAILSSTGTDHFITLEALGICLGSLILVSAVTRALLLVVNYPFSLTWSEGNRFYDYSLVFGSSLYNHIGKISGSYNSPGRYGLWGVLFLLGGLPIWVHRLWNIILLTVPPLLFGYLITRKLKPISLRYGMLLWITLFFVVIAPLHPPFMIVSILVVLFMFDSSIIKRGVLLVIASYYASLSRWTWIFAPAAIGALIDLILYYPARQGKWIRRILPTTMLVFFAVLPGLLQSLGQYFSFFGGESMTSNQPLLWYRLLPNSTLGPGVLFLALYTTGPLIIILTWWILSHRWKLDWVQELAIAGALSAFFLIGLIISTKIGGGGDLHNLDMYLVTLMVVVTLGLTMQTQQHQTSTIWPSWAMGLTILLVFIPLYGFTPFSPGASYNPWLDLPNASEINRVLSTIRTEVNRANQKGKILFMDQRQLLTFKYINPIPFIPEYEKKYMMDQAMGGNAKYFEEYYRDLANKRFALIVTEPLRTVLKSETGGPFSEENDVWVKWISDPTLCYYEKIYTSKKTNVELLIPKQNPVGCEKYLLQAGAN